MQIFKKPKIGIDCRFWGIKHAGLGRYTRELVLEVVRQASSEIDFVLFFQGEEWRKDRQVLNKCQIIEANVDHYSLKEQFLLKSIIDRENLDFIHFTHFNIPLVLKTPYIATIHDLIKHFFKGRPVTTRSLPVYWMKYGGYLIVIGNAISRAKVVISPSLFTKDQIAVHYKNSESKIQVIYEGVSKPFSQDVRISSTKTKQILEKYKLNSPFFIYTGSAYASKNVETLLWAFKKLLEEDPDLQLIIACARNFFWQKLSNLVKEMDLEKNVVLPGIVSDSDLQILYQKCLSFVMPSMMEGFGLPALEAMSSGALVISSNTASLPEIYEKNALYFNPYNKQKLYELLGQVKKLDVDKKEKIIKKGIKHAKSFSWEKAAEQTIDVYKQTLKRI
jgi:glycosyltransferase involved in cell wall biosynthesis